MKQGMKDSYEKGVANRLGPEFCAVYREALVGALFRRRHLAGLTAAPLYTPEKLEKPDYHYDNKES